MAKIYAILIIVLFISTNCFADVWNVLNPNAIVANACIYANTGVYSGELVMVPVYEDTIYKCEPGEYLPELAEECQKCPENSYCPGGDYTYSENGVVGLNACPESTPYAPIGMWTESQCGRKLHIDDVVLYVHQEPANPTEHRLYIRVNDVVYSANMTTVPTVMNRDSTHFLKIKYNSIEYYVCDDTTYKSDDAN